MSATGGQWVSSVCTECGASVHFELGAQQVRCRHCDAGLVVDQGQRLVRLRCPGCGGNFYYLDGSMSGHCPFCQVPLLAVSRRQVLRYLITPAAEPPAEAAGATLVMLPFWHLSGLLYGWNVGSKVSLETDPLGDVVETPHGDVKIPATVRRDSGPKKAFRSRVIDLSLPDPATAAFGVTSLRWRAAVFPMEPFAERHERLGRVVPPTLAIDTVRESLYERAMTLGTLPDDMSRLDCQRQDLISEELALYYYPFWLREDGAGEGRLWDGVTGEPEPTKRYGQPAPSSGPVRVFDELSLIELRCRECDAPLSGGNRSVIIPCMSCGRFWMVRRQGLQPFSASRAAVLLPEEADLAWLPFWRVPVRVRFQGREATQVKDLITQLGVMRPPNQSEPEPPEAPLVYYVPAYGSLRAPRIDHAARDMTRAQPHLEPIPTAEAGEVFHCFFDPDDARALAYVSWIQILPSSMGHQLRSLRLEAGEPALWYIPFEQRGRELTNLITGLRYDRSSFRGVRH